MDFPSHTSSQWQSKAQLQGLIATWGWYVCVLWGSWDIGSLFTNLSIPRLLKNNNKTPNSYRQCNPNSSFCRGRTWGQEMWTICLRVPRCWGTEPDLDLTSGSGPVVCYSAHNCGTCACLLSSHQCQALCLSSFLCSCVLQHLTAGGQSLPQPCQVLLVCAVHSTKCCWRCKRSPGSSGVCWRKLIFTISNLRSSSFYYIKYVHLLWTGNWHPSYRAVNQPCIEQLHALHNTLLTANRWQKGDRA